MNPEIIIPEIGLNLWHWYFDLSSSLTRVIDGQAMRIPPSEFMAWTAMTGRIVLSEEYAILRDMDAAFCAALSAEISDAHARQRAETEAKKPPPRKGK